ncbi:TPA: phage minor capsid protein [Clostridioides difficile]|nr:phage minor capsid protein [Clostridioides difficile]
MLTSNKLQEIPKYFVSLFQTLEDFVIADIARRIAKAGNITDMAEWQLIRAEEIGMADKVIKMKIAEILDISFEAVDKLFEENAVKSIESDSALYEHAKLTPLHLNSSEELKNYVSSAKEQTKGKLKNMTGTLGFCTIKKGKVISKKLTDIYIESLDLAQFQVSTGVLDYKTAVKKAVKRLADSGLRFIDYETGWTNRIDVATRRAVLTGVNQMSQNINNKVINDLDTDIVEVTAHSGARCEGAGIKNHKKWQGKWYSLSGKSTKYPSLKVVTGWGQGDGLGGWNCSHQFHAVIPGISVPAYSKEQLKNIDPPDIGYKGRTYTHYQALQYQRKIETSMRQTKRQLIAYESAGLKDEFTNASIKLQRQKQEYREFSKIAKLRLQNERHQVFGYNKSVSQKAVHASKKERKNG